MNYESVARKMVLAAIDYLEHVQACPFCDCGHDVYETAPKHAPECPFSGFELTVDVEALRAWARHPEPTKAGE